MPTIIQKDNALLREKAAEVPDGQLTSPRIAKIIKELKVALSSQEDGVAIAAPQIGESVRIFVVSEKVFELSDKVEDRRKQQKKASQRAFKYLIFINPTITKLSRQKKLMEEGCLSVRWLYGKVKRSTKVSIRAYDEQGKPFERGASGLLAQIFQHETDHLDGVLFIDKAVDLHEMNPQEIDL